MPTPPAYIAFVYHKNGFALALQHSKGPVHVTVKPDTLLPTGFSECVIEISGNESVAKSPKSCDGSITTKQADLLKKKWAEDYKPCEWNEGAWKQPFLSLDIESDGADIWEVALIPSDGLGSFIAKSGVSLLTDLQDALDRLLPSRILVGHNLRRWDITILKRHGIKIPSIETWDTLEKEQELCKDRSRPSYALHTTHHAEQDAIFTLNLARNQWLRSSEQKAPSHVAESAWDASDQYFIVPAPTWTKLVTGLNVARNKWSDIEKIYQSITLSSMDKDILNVVWHGIKPPHGDSALDPFNPASPKRLDYWHRLLPAIEVARGGNQRSILFIQHQEECDKLVRVLEDAFTENDTRRGVRRLVKSGGLLILHESKWSLTLSEGIPEHTSLILERIPESNSGSKKSQTVYQTEYFNEGEGVRYLDTDDPDTDLEEAEDTVNEGLVTNGRQSTADLFELAKMTFWQRVGEANGFICLDARFWSRRRQAPCKLRWINCEWRPSFSRESMEPLGFRQTTSECNLTDDWEKKICEWFHVSELRPFQQIKLAKILPRDNQPYHYVERATGGGKSLIFQAAALYRGATTGRITVVVSPLRALIHDQVNKLHEKGFAVDVEALSGSMSRDDIEEAYRRIAGGETKLVYTAPERFRSDGFLKALETRIRLDDGGQPEYWVFDEAHCISLWGLDFRPDYRKAAKYIQESRKQAKTDAAPVLLVSATLTRLAKDDIETVLGLK